jgi:hypothetical protein
MLKLTAILRTLVLAGLAGYLIWAMPLGILFSGTSTREAASFKVEVIESVARAAWLAIGWVALETIGGWVRVWSAARAAAKVSRPAGPPAP